MITSELVFGDIVLINFPFTNFSVVKKRPALILFNTTDKDLIVCRITSHLKETDFDIEIIDWQAAGLRFPSTIRLHKIVTLESSLIEKKMGTLSASNLGEVKGAVRKILSELT